jgi:hypothetical protein
MIKQAELGGTLRLPGTSLGVNRMGYGAVQLAWPAGVGTAARC